MNDIWNINFEWIQNEDLTIEKIERYQGYETDNVNDMYFKIQKAFSGVCFTYADSLENIYKYDLLTGDGYSMENLFNEYEVMNRYLKNFIQVDVASVENVDINEKIYTIDGVKLKTNHLVLIKNQTDSKENDVYKVDEKNFLILTDYLSTREKSDKFKVSVKLGLVNSKKQWFLYYDGYNRFPITGEQKCFVERHSYILKHRLTYDIDSIPTYSGNTHKLVFSDYDIARKMNNKNAILWTGATIDVSSLAVGKTFDIYYYHQPYRITVSSTSNLYDEYIEQEVNCVPNMTSNTTPAGLCFSNSVLTTMYEPWKAFNYDVPHSNQWRSIYDNAWIGYKFDTPKTIWKYSIFFNDEPFIERAPRDWTLEASNDNITWVTLDTQINEIYWSGSTYSNIYREYEIPNRNSYLYYRLNITSNNGDTTISIGEIQFFEVALVAGTTTFTPYLVSDITNVERVGGTYEKGYDTTLSTLSFPSVSFSAGDYLDIEFRLAGELFSRFNTTVKSVGTNTITLTDYIPTWVANQFDDLTASGITWIIRNRQYADSSLSGFMLALKNSLFRKYYSVSNPMSTLILTPIDYEYNKEFDYGSLSFVYDSVTYRFTTDNDYINYNLKDFLYKAGSGSTVFTANTPLYNSQTLSPISQFYQDKDIIQLNSDISTLSNFRPFTYVEITGATHTGITLILKVEDDYLWVERPKYFNYHEHESVVQIKNITELSRISDILYDVYKNEDYGNYIPKSDFMIKNIYLYYGSILNESIVRFYCMGLLTETSAINRNFIFKLYNIENDSNMLLEIGYRPIEVMDVGVDKKTMIPKPLIYPDYFTYYPNIYDLGDDWKVLDGDGIVDIYGNFIYLYMDGSDNTTLSIVIDDSI